MPQLREPGWGPKQCMATSANNPPFAQPVLLSEEQGKRRRSMGLNRLAKVQGKSAAAATLAASDPDSQAMLCVAVDAETASAHFNDLVERYHRLIHRFLYRMVQNQAIAEELTQEVFLRVYRSRHTYRAEARFSTWLYRIATNVGVNHARDTRHERNARSFSLDEQDPETGVLPEVADARLTAEQALTREAWLGAIRQQVMALPERQRNAVLLHKFQELDYKQIGAVLRLSESATKSLLFRAYENLRERLKAFAPKHAGTEN